MSETSVHHGPETAAAVKHRRREVPKQVEDQPLLDFEILRQALTEQVEVVQQQFKVKHRHLLKWAARNGYALHFLGDIGGKAIVAGGLMASLVLSTPQNIAHSALGSQSPPRLSQAQAEQQMHQAVEARKKYQMTVIATAQKHAQEQQQAVQQLEDIASHHSKTTDAAVQDQAAQLLSLLTGVPATSQLESYRLQTTIGRIGAEQHLKRYPGDNLNEHDYQASGFAPGLGAYGYFAASKAAMTPEAVAREKYYVAVQTFMSPNWSVNVHATYDWFKYRKVIVYDPWTKQAVVADVGDAGPAPSTGKVFGGSPEVMASLQAHDGHGSPPVMMFFVNDPDNKIPLGPVQFAVEATP